MHGGYTVHTFLKTPFYKAHFIILSGPPRQPRMPRIGPCQVLAATLPYLNQGEQTMPTQYWGPWLAKIRRGGPVKQILIQN